MPEENTSEMFSALSGLVLDVAIRQVALMGLIRSELNLDDAKIHKAIAAAAELLTQNREVASLRSRTTVKSLEQLDISLCTISSVHLKKDLT